MNTNNHFTTYIVFTRDGNDYSFGTTTCRSKGDTFWEFFPAHIPVLVLSRDEFLPMLDMGRLDRIEAINNALTTRSLELATCLYYVIWRFEARIREALDKQEEHTKAINKDWDGFGAETDPGPSVEELLGLEADEE